MRYALNLPGIAELSAGKPQSILSGIRRIASKVTFRRALVCGLFAIFSLSNPAVAGSAPLVLYTFNEGQGSTVHDTSGTGQPLNLTITNPAAVTWNASNSSLKINSETLIASSAAATKVITALRASNAVTIEAWIQPSNTTQSGPARIFTLSKNAYKRNLTLGQKETSYIARLRTTKTSNNGTPQISSPAGTLNTSLMHVVYSRDTTGTATLYINGVKQYQTTTGGNFSNWDSAYRLALGDELDGGRPWLGTYHQFALYDRAFSAIDVSQAFAAGRNAPVNATMISIPASYITSTSVDSIPVAVNDSVNATNFGYWPGLGMGITIDPLSNDSGLNDTPVTLSIISGPAHGQSYVVNSKIWYQPVSTFTGTDSITYRVTDADGDWSTATVTIDLTCSVCNSVSSKSLKVSWNASVGSVLGYYVYYGSMAISAVNFASQVPATVNTFTALASDLNLQAGQQVCFRVRAYNTVGVSPYSSAICSII